MEPKVENFDSKLSHRGCFGDGPGRINTTESYLCIDTRNFKENLSYVFTVNATRGTQLGFGKLIVKKQNVQSLTFVIK